MHEIESNATNERIRWRCKRGMLELDKLLLNFFDNCYPTLNKKSQENFQRLLEIEDDKLWAAFMGVTMLEDEVLNDMLLCIRYLYKR